MYVQKKTLRKIMKTSDKIQDAFETETLRNLGMKWRETYSTQSYLLENHRNIIRAFLQKTNVHHNYTV